MIGFGRYNSLGIGLAVYLKDHFSNNAQKINAQMTQMHGNSRRLAQTNMQGLSTVGATLGVMGYGVLRFTRRAIEELAIFEKEMSTIKAVTNDNTLSMAQLEKEIRRVGTSGIYSIDQIAKAAAELGRAGFTRMQIKETLQAASDLGAAGNIDVEQAADSIGRILNMFDLAANQSGHVADLIAVAANKSAVSITDLLESLKYSGDVLKSLNIPMEESLAMFMKLGNAGLRGSMAGTSVANMVRYLNKAVTDFRTKRQDQAINMLGLNPEDLIDSHGNMKSIVDIMDKLRISLSGMPTNKAQAIMEALTGVRGQRALIPLMALTKNTKSMKDFLEMLKDPSISGSVRRIAEQMMDNVWGDIEKLKDNWKNFQIEFARLPGLRFLIQGLTKVLSIVTKIISTPFGKVLGSAVVIFGAIALVAGTVLTTMGFMAQSVRALGLNYSIMGVQGTNAFRSIAMSANLAAAAQTRANMAGNANIFFKGGAFRGAGGQFVKGGASRIGGTGANLLAGMIPLSRTTAVTTANMGRLGVTTGRLLPMFGALTGSLGSLIPWIAVAASAFQAFGALGQLLQGNLGGFAAGMFKASGFGMVADWLAGGKITKGIENLVNTGSVLGPDEQTVTVGGKGTRRISQEEWQAMYGGGQNVENNSMININIDGYNTMQKNITNSQNEDVYQEIGQY